MPRYRVSVHRENIHFVDAHSPESAACKGIALDASNVRPAYTLEAIADVDMLAESEAQPVALREPAQGKEKVQ